ncbi:IpaB/EvcA family protein [Liquorilactobacillus mali]|uniref:IpaB/EvcA family protein n=1 Tax=Liquorilactobacillus mali TaxID=1618 RepID=UPI0029530233|nr:IpaB/EvcA family protein [Liquorilactobacillus mali]MDV7758140.1 IpaB/EvcA family protein [Liquorilactobacillus mali]
MTEVSLNEQTKDLLKKAKIGFPNEIKIIYKDEKAGFIRHDQAQQYLSGGDLIIEVNDITCPDYTLTHELLHLLVRINNVPEIIFNLTTKNQNLDNNFLATGFELYNTILHFEIYDMQRQMGLFSEKIQDLYLKGITETLKPEPETEVDNVMVLRIVQLFDALVFFGKEVQKVATVFEKNYPRAYRAARQLFEAATKKNLTGVQGLHRAVIRVFTQFDECLDELGLMGMNLREFITLTPVVSERQLKLEVRQVFNIKNSQMYDVYQDKPAYIGLGIYNEQNSFVITAPNVNSDKFFKDLYGMRVAFFFDKFEIPYLKR